MTRSMLRNRWSFPAYFFGDFQWLATRWMSRNICDHFGQSLFGDHIQYLFSPARSESRNRWWYWAFSTWWQSILGDKINIEAHVNLPTFHCVDLYWLSKRRQSGWQLSPPAHDSLIKLEEILKPNISSRSPPSGGSVGGRLEQQHRPQVASRQAPLTNGWPSVMVWNFLELH